ncbi:unnamed protein product [Urochloa humidicola]
MANFGLGTLGELELEPGVIAGRLIQFWNEWATQFLVIASLTQQILLLFLSRTRRRQGNKAKRLLSWLPYQLAEISATYALTNFSPSSTIPEHRLVAFWAPFLLLHLAGPDNISAYSIEDNELWKRHRLTLSLQVVLALYVLRKQLAGSEIMLFSLGSTLSAVAIAKCCEKIRALRSANFSIIQRSLKTAETEEQRGKCYLYLEDEPPRGGFRGKVVDEEEFLMLRAHVVFRVCKSAMVDSSELLSSYVGGIIEKFKENEPEYMWKLMEMELSLMYDILYTKAAVVHTLGGYCIRAISPLVVLASFLLFQFHGISEGLNSVDVRITYALFAGAFFMETTSLLSALWSTWTFSFLCATPWSGLRHAAFCSERWHRLRRVVLSLRRLAYNTPADCYFSFLSRRWSGTMGQYNMLDMCTARPTLLLGRFTEVLGQPVGVPEELKSFVFAHIEHMIQTGSINSLGVVREKWGIEALQRAGLNDEVLLQRLLGAEFHEAIIIWHIATDIFLAQRDKTKDKHIVKDVKALSNYMMFLLVKRPHMLPGLTQNKLYQWTKESLTAEWRSICLPKSTSGLPPSENLANVLYSSITELEPLRPDIKQTRLRISILLARLLMMSSIDTLPLVYEIWSHFLIYTANRCNRESHAKRLSRGGEFTTLVWLMIEHLHQVRLHKHKEQRTA